MSVSLHRLIRASMGSFPAAFVVPSWNKEYPDTFLHSAEVVACTHKRSKPCCTSELHARPHFLCVGPSRWSKPITVLLRDPAYPSFCNGWLAIGIIPNFLGHYPACHGPYSLTFRELPCLPRALFPIFTALPCLPWPKVFPPIFGGLNLIPVLEQSIIDHQYHGILTGIPPSCCSQQDSQLLWYGASVDMRKEVGAADFSIPF
jgi:hypothetical protein